MEKRAYYNWKHTGCSDSKKNWYDAENYERQREPFLSYLWKIDGSTIDNYRNVREEYKHQIRNFSDNQGTFIVDKGDKRLYIGFRDEYYLRYTWEEIDLVALGRSPFYRNKNRSTDIVSNYLIDITIQVDY